MGQGVSAPRRIPGCVPSFGALSGPCPGPPACPQQESITNECLLPFWLPRLTPNTPLPKPHVRLCSGKTQTQTVLTPLPPGARALCPAPSWMQVSSCP